MSNVLNNAMYVLASTDVNCAQGSPLVKALAIVRLVMNVICIAVPIVMIVLGTIDLFKAVTAGKDEDIKKKQQTLIKRIIAGVLVFLVPTIVSLLMSLLGAGGNWADCWNNARTANFKDLFNGNVNVSENLTG